MKLIGKIFLFFALNLFAVEAILEKNEIKQGESATLIFRLSGENIKIPDLKEINGYEISQKNQSQNIIKENNQIKRIIDLYYVFYPDSNTTIPSFDFIIDGQKQSTKELNLVVLENENKDIIINASLNKSSAYIGEMVVLSLDVKFKQNSISNPSLQIPNLENFIQKDIKQEKPTLENDYVHQKLHYYLVPKNEGEIEIEPFMIHAFKLSEQNFGFFSNEKIIQIKSNKTKLQVTQSNELVVGKFELEVKADKTEAKAYESVNLEILIKGYGNFDDIAKFELNDTKAIVFSDTPKIKTTIDEDKLKGEYSQKFALSANEDFVIDGISFSYFDIEKNETRTLLSKDILIKILNPQKTPPFTQEKKIIYIEKNLTFSNILIFVFGFALGVLSFFLARNIKFKKRQKDKNLRELILYYGKDKKLDEWIEKVEQNYKTGAKHKINKQEIKQIISNLGEKDENHK